MVFDAGIETLEVGIGYPDEADCCIALFAELDVTFVDLDFDCEEIFYALPDLEFSHVLLYVLFEPEHPRVMDPLLFFLHPFFFLLLLLPLNLHIAIKILIKIVRIEQNFLNLHQKIINCPHDNVMLIIRQEELVHFYYHLVVENLDG